MLVVKKKPTHHTMLKTGRGNGSIFQWGSVAGLHGVDATHIGVKSRKSPCLGLEKLKINKFIH